jgi:septal ring factor EnvC (AmiA/AmiB activator)
MGATRLHLAVALFTASGGVALGNPRTDAALRLQKAEQLRAAQESHRQDAERALQDAQALGAHLGDQRVRSTAALRATEDSVVDAAMRLHRAQAAQDKAETALKERAAAFSALVPLMLRMSRYPAETVLAIPAPPDEALEGLLVTRGIAASLNREAASLRAAEQHASQSQADTRREAAALAARRLVQQNQAAALDRDVAAAQAKISQAEREGQEAALQVAALAAQAQTLRDAIAAMDAARAKSAAAAARDAARADKQNKTGAAQLARATEAALTRPSLKQGMSPWWHPSPAASCAASARTRQASPPPVSPMAWPPAPSSRALALDASASRHPFEATGNW